MKTQGPRMNSARTSAVLAKLGIPIAKADAHGYEIRRTICPGGMRPPSSSILSFMETERWQVRTSNGIVPNAASVWLSPVVHRVGPLGAEPYKTRGPYWNKTQLEKALRAWRRGE